jgi:hypothetical protein
MTYKETKAHLQKAERQSYWKYINNIIEIGDPDQEDRPPKQKRFWSYIKSLRILAGIWSGPHAF